MGQWLRLPASQAAGRGLILGQFHMPHGEKRDVSMTTTPRSRWEGPGGVWTEKERARCLLTDTSMLTACLSSAGQQLCGSSLDVLLCLLWDGLSFGRVLLHGGRKRDCSSLCGCSPELEGSKHACILGSSGVDLPPPLLFRNVFNC